MHKLFEASIELLSKPEFTAGVTYPKFLSIFTTGLVANQNREQIRIMFNFLDEDNSGTIKLNDFKRLSKEIGESVTLDELTDMIKNVTGGNISA